MHRASGGAASRKVSNVTQRPRASVCGRPCDVTCLSLSVRTLRAHTPGYLALCNVAVKRRSV
eukprot:210306-Prymnesium_polylepis.1